MERKTIGGFIAALRKANGMTQRELAGRLNVSDKPVSRWERDEGTPDLGTIPVIAEVFGITCDELLCGERRPIEERTGISDTDESSSKGEKQRRRLLKSAMSKYKSLSFIATGISAAGLMAALICNLAFLKAVLGFFMGAVFYIVSIVCLMVFVNRANLRVEDGGLDEGTLSAYKRQVIRIAEMSIG